MTAPKGPEWNNKMNGKIAGISIVGTAIVAAAAMYYFQEYGYTIDVATDAPVQLTTLAGPREDILTENLQAYDATSSPLRYRACFTTPQSQAMLTETYKVVDDPVPLTGPRWFDCYDAATVGAALETGEAIAFLGQADIHEGVDRVVAVFPDGRAFVWHQLNEKLTE